MPGADPGKLFSEPTGPPLSWEETQDATSPIIRPDPFEGWHSAPFGTVGPCVDGQADVLEEDRLGILPVKQVKVLGSVAERPINRGWSEEVVRAGEDTHGNGVDSLDLVQDKPKVRDVRPVAVEQVPHNKYSVRPVIPGQGQDASECLSDLGPDRPTELPEEPERPTDVHISGVDEPNHHNPPSDPPQPPDLLFTDHGPAPCPAPSL